MGEELSHKYDRLLGHLAALGKVAVAVSGGVDSSLVLYAARQALGGGVLALHARMPWQASDEEEHVRSMARLCGSRLDIVEINPLLWPEFVENPVDRCYYCKKRIFTLFREQAELAGFTILVDGTNADDLHQFRPGLAALEELGVAKPLSEVGLSKSEIRQISREKNLPTWNMPPGSCLATRIASGEPVTMEKLALVRQAEELLVAGGFTGCRARLLGDTLRIELQQVDIERFFLSDRRQDLIDWVKATSIRKVYLDLEGRRELRGNGLFT